MIVGEDLDFDVARPLDQPLDVQGAVAERRLRLAAGRRRRLVDVASVPRGAHALAAATGRRLDQDGEADRLRRGGDAGIGLVRRRPPGHDRHAGLLHEGARADLRSHGLDGARRRSDEDQPGVRAGAREGGALGQEPVSRMNRIRPRLARGVDDGRDLQVAFARLGRPDAHGPVRGHDVRRVGVGVGIDGDGLDTQLAAGADDADRDLAAVGDEQASNRAHHLIHDGGRLARNAPMPSCPSADTRRSAIASIVCSVADVRVASETSAIRRFAAATACGADVDDVVDVFRHHAIEVGFGTDGVHEADRLGALGGEARAGQEQLARRRDARSSRSRTGKSPPAGCRASLP